MPTNRKLPIGIQTFREIREDGHYYVDKTPFIQRLVAEGKHYFLSRPRRFGKSLLLDTIKELFEANEPLFRGLAIHHDWDWFAPHPVLRLSFGSGNVDDMPTETLLFQTGCLTITGEENVGGRRFCRLGYPKPRSAPEH